MIPLFVIVVYDIEVERINKVRKTLREYLFWVQNSVFEGEIGRSSLAELKTRLRDIIDESYDSIVIYRMNSPKSMKREVIGMDYSMSGFII